MLMTLFQIRGVRHSGGFLKGRFLPLRRGMCLSVSATSDFGQRTVRKTSFSNSRKPKRNNYRRLGRISSSVQCWRLAEDKFLKKRDTRLKSIQFTLCASSSRRGMNTNTPAAAKFSQNAIIAFPASLILILHIHDPPSSHILGGQFKSRN